MVVTQYLSAYTRNLTVRINKPTHLRVVIAALEVVQTGLLVVVVTPAAKRNNTDTGPTNEKNIFMALHTNYNFIYPPFRSQAVLTYLLNFLGAYIKAVLTSQPLRYSLTLLKLFPQDVYVLLRTIWMN